VLLASGRRPRLSGLGLEELGISAGPGEMLPLDETCRVVPNAAVKAVPIVPAGTAPGAAGAAAKKTSARVWAAGDVTAVAPYTHTARYQAQIVAANILGGHRAADYRAIPRTVYTSPSVYTVGMSPSLAAATGVELITASYDLAETARATVEDDDRGRVELYADAGAGDILVGAAAIGPDAEEWMGEVTLAIRARIPLAVLADVVHAFPTYGEAVGRPLRGLTQRPAAQASGKPEPGAESRDDASAGSPPASGGDAGTDAGATPVIGHGPGAAADGNGGPVTGGGAGPTAGADAGAGAAGAGAGAGAAGAGTPAAQPARTLLGQARATSPGAATGPGPEALPSRKPAGPPNAGTGRLTTQPSPNT